MLMMTDSESRYSRSTVIESFADLTDDEMSVDRLAEMCNSPELDPAHLCDVVEDFLASL